MKKTNKIDMNKIIITLIFTLIYNLTINGQTKELNNNANSIEIVLNRIAEGFGPNGNVSIQISSRNKIDSLELSAYPKMKNIPDNLNNVVEYCFHLNRFQFFYQNYRSGIFPKDYFLREVIKRKWNLKDTIQLSEKNLKTTISIATGFNSEGIGMYIIDSQNNDDFSDDALKVLLTSTPFEQDKVISVSSSIDVEHFDGISVKKEKQLMFVKLSAGKSEKLTVSFSFPQFIYGKFNYKNKSYIVCGEPLNDNQSIYILDDKPYFIPPGDSKEVEPFQFIVLDGDYFQYIPKSKNSGQILLKKVIKSKNDNGNEILKNTITATNQSKLPVASQIAMLAPEISGIDILNNLNISLNSIKGKYVFIDFWSTTCAPCISEFPNIKEVYEKIDRSKLEIIGIVEDRTPDGKIKEFLQKKGVTWPNINIITKSTNIKGYNIRSYPTTYLINPNGVIIATNLRGTELFDKLQSLKLKE